MPQNFEQLELPGFDSDDNKVNNNEVKLEAGVAEDDQEVGGPDHESSQDNKSTQPETDRNDVFKRVAEMLDESEKDDTAYDDLHGRKMR